jgi:predicted RNA-binding Zn ribbon-like protein
VVRVTCPPSSTAAPLTLTTGTAERERAGCAVAFTDSSRNGRRKFCSVRCANQVNVARHRGRQRRTSVALSS